MMKRSLLLLCMLIGLSSAGAQNMPEKCLTLPSRTQVCPHLIYKKSPIDFESTNTTKGQVVCICLADFINLRIPAQSKLDKIEQQAELTRSAKALKIAPETLLKLLRE